MSVDEAYEKDEKQPRPKGLPTWYDIREKQEEDIKNGLAGLLFCRGMTGEQRLKALEGLAIIYINIPDDDDVKSVIDGFANHICHVCGEVCGEDVDEEHDESYIVCRGGSSLQFKDKSKGVGNSMEEFNSNLRWSKPNKCKNVGQESMGITWIVDRLLKNAKAREKAMKKREAFWKEMIDTRDRNA
jgi:hypothetical protein